MGQLKKILKKEELKIPGEHFEVLSHIGSVLRQRWQCASIGHFVFLFLPISPRLDMHIALLSILWNCGSSNIWNIWKTYFIQILFVQIENCFGEVVSKPALVPVTQRALWHCCKLEPNFDRWYLHLHKVNSLSNCTIFQVFRIQ